MESSRSAIMKYSAIFIAGSIFSFLISKIKSRIKLKQCTDQNLHKNNTNIKHSEDQAIINLNSETQLVREQLKRNYEFFGDTGMKLITESFVVVVGIGGVGSHVLATLVRSGIKRIRVIDYDIVTLSSLNRHAFALRRDVGKLKVRVVKEYAEAINPNLEIDMIEDAYIYEHSDDYILEGNPDYIVDCIDDLEAKCELLKYCKDNNLRVISSLGAGAKMDPSQIRFANLYSIKGENLAKRMRYGYKKKFNEQIPDVKCVYSIEKSERGLTDLEDHQKTNPENYRINTNERIRSIPVFASIPAIFGQSIASLVLTDLAGINLGGADSVNTGVAQEIAKTQMENYVIGNVNIIKLVEDYKREETAKRKMRTEDIDLDIDDFINIADTFNKESSLSQKPGAKLKFMRWDYTKPISKNNIVILNKSEQNKHFELKGEEMLRKYYSNEDYDRITNTLKNIK